MDFSTKVEYTKEQEEFAKEVRAWADENVPKDMVTPRDVLKISFEQGQLRRELGRKLGEKGWLYPRYPRQYGGGGLDAAHCSVLRREFAERKLGLPPYYSNTLAVTAILSYGTEEQKKRFLPSIFKGEVVTWQLFTEPEAGTDEANQQTNALRSEREGEYFIVNGQKIFVGGQHYSPEELRFWLLTRSDPQAPRHENLATFIAPANLPGITIIPLDLFIASTFPTSSGRVGGGPGVKNQVFFDDVRIHESYLIGGDHDGWKTTTATLTVEHGDRSGEASGGEGGGGMAESILVEKFLEQCKSNPNIVKRLRENPQLLDSVVNVYIDGQIARLFSLRNASRKGGRYGGPQATLYSKKAGTRIITEMARVLGPYTLTDDDEWGLDEGIFEVGQRSGVCQAPGGTPEALKIVISRALAIGR